MHSNRVGIFDTAGMAADIVGSASHGARSMDHIVANRPNIAATANNADTANTVDIEDPNMGRSRGHTLAPEGRGHPKQAKRRV
jgi:hypothetical protein